MFLYTNPYQGFKKLVKIEYNKDLKSTGNRDFKQ